MKKGYLWGIAGIGIALVLIGGSVYTQNTAPGEYDQFAQCLGEQGLKFYGAFWCPHCNDQKEMFGNSAKHLPYIECSTANRRGQLNVCEDAGITAYPTWHFPNGEEVTGVLSFEALSEKSGCALPQQQ